MSLNGGDLVSTWIAKLEVHAEDVSYPRIKMLQTYSCKRWQLRSSCL